MVMRTAVMGESEQNDISSLNSRLMTVMKR